MKILILFSVILTASFQFVQAEQILIGNHSSVDFSALLTEDNNADFIIENKEIKDMSNGDIKILISDVKWNNDQMANYQQRYGSHPRQIVIAAFNDKTNATMQQQADVFSTRDGSKLLYLYINEVIMDGTNQELVSLFTENDQTWLSEQGLMAIPDIVQQQNLVTLGLKEPLFEGGYQ